MNEIYQKEKILKKIADEFDSQFDLSLGLSQKNNHDSDIIHYTSADSFLKMIKNKQFWLRNAIAMNDTVEIKHGLKNLENFFFDKKNIRGFGDDVWLQTSLNIETMAEYTFPKFIKNTYLGCYSEYSKEDGLNGKLSMWRAYAKNNGCAIIFDKNNLLEMVKSTDVRLQPVSYKTDGQIQDALNNFWQKIGGPANIDSIKELSYCERRDHRRSVSLGNMEDGNKLLEIFRQFLVRYSTILKHPAFEEEKEWRMIVHASHNSKTLQVESISGIPQLVYKLPLDSGEVPINKLIKKIIIGPTEQAELILEALKFQLSEYFIENELDSLIHEADIPLRQ